jgi:septal ring-binding cell division protein DamX
MSTTAEARPANAPAPAESACAQCGSPMAEDQEWCLECGSARTLIHAPPDWRIPVAVIGTVVVLVLAAFAIALVSLSGTANDNTQTVSRSAAPRTATAAPAAAAKPPAAGKPAAAPAGRPAAIASWPVGLSGWTVVLFKNHVQAIAEAHARRAAKNGLSVGVLNSSQHPSLAPGFWIVFAGRYPDQAKAAAAALNLRGRGHRRARARRVARPGGL